MSNIIFRNLSHKLLTGYAQGLTVKQNYTNVTEMRKIRAANPGIGMEKILTPAAERRLLRALGPRDRELVRFLLATGTRISEALGIREGDIQRMGDHYSIRVIGKGSKRRTVYYDRMADFTAIGSRIAITNRIRRASLQVLGRTLSAHCMRHTFATRKIAEGKSLPAVSRYLGHSSVVDHRGSLCARRTGLGRCQIFSSFGASSVSSS